MIALLIAVTLKTVVSVGLMPAVGLEGVRPRVTITILNPTADNYCPSVNVEWFPGFTSLQESDCLPFDQVDPKDRTFRWSRQSPVEFPSGEWNIRVVLQQGKWRQIKTTTIHVGGG
jgi:hypothetical protein